MHASVLLGLVLELHTSLRQAFHSVFQIPSWCFCNIGIAFLRKMGMPLLGNLQQWHNSLTDIN